jgi:GNAT superfamily N-acetyltransferase
MMNKLQTQANAQSQVNPRIQVQSQAQATAIDYCAATPTDAPLLLSVLLRAYAEFWGTLDPPSGTFIESAASIDVKIQKGGAIKAVAARSIAGVVGEEAVGEEAVGEEVVGVVLYEPRDDYMYFGRLAVLPDWRRLGIARSLIAAVEERAKAIGLSRVQIGVRLVLASHQDYYAALGYRPLVYECHPGFTEPTSVTMEKVLS